MAQSKTLYLIDGHAFIFRSFFAERSLSTSTGLPTNAIFGFTNSLLKVLENQNVEYIACAFDSGRPTFRNEIFPQYKANRPEPPGELKVQIPYIIKILDAMRIKSFSVKGYEADDILGTLALRAKDAGFDVVIVTSDKDIFQLVDDRVRVLDPWKEIVYDGKKVEEKMGVEPRKIRDLLALTGDTSDNVPGVPKIGPKTAAALLNQFGTLQRLLDEALKRHDDKRLAKIAEHRQTVAISEKLVTIRTDVPLEADLAQLRRTEPDQQRLLALLQELEFASLVGRLLQNAKSEKKDYRTILTDDQLAKLKHELAAADEFAVDTETTGKNPLLDEIIGLSFSTKPNTGYYIPLAHHYIGAPKQLKKEHVFSQLRPILEDPTRKKIGQNIKFDILVLRNCGIELEGISFDTMVADYLLRPTQKSHGLDALALQHLGWQTSKYKELVPPRSSIRDLRDVSVEKVTYYAAEDADITFMLKHKLSEQLGRQGLVKLFVEIEMPLVAVLADMEARGVKLDVGVLNAMSKELDQRLLELEEKIYFLAGEEFKINSPKQLAHILFEKLKLPHGRKTKKEFSTDQAVLESLARLHPLPKEVLLYRELSKIKSTYVDALPKLVNPRTGRIHTSFNQTVTATGRLSSSDPNLQNIPIRSPIGRKIREAFVPEDGFLLASFDYSQIELRILAHLSGDPELTKAFEEGVDVHRRTAATIFGVPEDKVDETMRSQAKTVNFGVIYGMGPFTLAAELGIDRSRAKQYINEYFTRYSGVKAYIDTTLEAAARDGYVTTMFGRKRVIPEIKSDEHHRREAAKRIAINTPVQGTCADIIKLVMTRIHRALKDKHLDAYMILQVHDELVFEIREDHLEDAINTIKPIMEHSVELKVPLITSCAVGRNWGQAK